MDPHPEPGTPVLVSYTKEASPLVVGRTTGTDGRVENLYFTHKEMQVLAC